MEEREERIREEARQQKEELLQQLKLQQEQIQQQQREHQELMNFFMSQNHNQMTSPPGSAPSTFHYPTFMVSGYLISPSYFLLFCCLTELRILQPGPSANMVMPFYQPQHSQSPVTPGITVNNTGIIRSLTSLLSEFPYTCAQRASRL